MEEEAQFLSVIQSLDTDALIDLVADELREERGDIEQRISEGNVNQLGERIGRLLDIKQGGIVRKSFPPIFMATSAWGRVKREMYLLLCTNDKKYSSLRRSLSKQGAVSQAAVVSAISGAVGASLGYVAVAMMPLVALTLVAALKVGKEAYCAGLQGTP